MTTITVWVLVFVMYREAAIIDNIATAKDCAALKHEIILAYRDRHLRAAVCVPVVKARK